MPRDKNPDPVENEEEKPLKNEVENSVRITNFWDKLKYIRSNITVEPVVILYYMPAMLDLLATQNLNLDKACRVNLQFDDAVCTDLSLRKRNNHTFEEDAIQELIASVQGWKGIVLAAVPTMLIFFIGAWSDKTGSRKICMIAPILGALISCILNMINTYFFYEVSVEWTAFMEVIFIALSGGSCTFLLGTYSYISDISSRETRTFRLGIFGIFVTISFPIGFAVSGVLLKYLGYYGVFTLSALLRVVNLSYVMFAIQDHTWLDFKEKDRKKGCTGFLAEFFDFNSLKDTFRIAFKKAATNRRLRICLAVFVVALDYGPFFGELSVMYIFVRYHFNWDEVKYSMYSTYCPIMHAVGTTFSLSLFSKKLGMDDALLGVIATLSKIAGSIMLAFVRNGTEVYFVPLVQILDGTTSIALRSIVSKLVSHQEIGKVFSLFGLTETMIPLIFVPLYTRVYVLTLHILPGAPFLLTVVATIPSTGIFLWFYRRHKKDARERALNIRPASTAIYNVDSA